MKILLQLKIVLHFLIKYQFLLASLDTEPLFTNITLEVTIKICCESLCNIDKNQYEKYLRATPFSNYFFALFINKFME